MDKLDLLNKIKWQIKMRMPNGGIYEKCLDRIKFGDKRDNINYIFSGSYLEISILEMFIRGYYSVSEKDLKKFYSFLCNSPQVNVVKIKENMYLEVIINSQSVILSMPNFEIPSEAITYRFEILDLILPYLLTSYENFSKISFNEGPYEYKDRYIDVSLNEGDIVLDLGTNFGIFSSYAASKGCEVYSFEPLTYAIKEYLEKLQVIYSNMTIVNKAVSNKCGKMSFFIDKMNFGGSALIDGKSENKVSVTTIDKFVSEENLKSVDFIKADIEGEEIKMLEGAFYTLKEFAPKLAICIYHNLNDEQSARKLIKNANPNYIIRKKWKKIYAEVKK